MKFEAIGTHWSIETPTPLEESLRSEIAELIESFDMTYSRFRDDSLVGRIARQAGAYEFPQDSRTLIAFYRAMYDATHEAVTPLVGSALEALGYDKTYSFVTKGDVAVNKWDEVMSWNDTTLKVSRPLTLDFGAAGKGYLVDIIGRALEDHGVTEYIIDASGDVRVFGDEEQSIGLEDPNDPTRVIGVAKVKNASLCASATNRRKWGNRMHHVIDGRTGAPTRDVIATWVVAESTLVADGIATALFFCSAKDLQELGQFQFVRMFNDGKVEHSRDFVGELFI